jgi:hypothetical protein
MIKFSDHLTNFLNQIINYSVKPSDSNSSISSFKEFPLTVFSPDIFHSIIRSFFGIIFDKIRDMSVIKTENVISSKFSRKYPDINFSSLIPNFSYFPPTFLPSKLISPLPYSYIYFSLLNYQALLALYFSDIKLYSLGLVFITLFFFCILF